MWPLWLRQKQSMTDQIVKDGQTDSKAAFNFAGAGATKFYFTYYTTCIIIIHICVVVLTLSSL